MYKGLLFFAALMVSVNGLALAGQSNQVITLKDGSQIKGELAGIDNGQYTIKTPIIGDVHVAASDVASITNGSNAVAAAPTQPSVAATNPDQQIAAAQQQLLSNPQTVAYLQQMAQDPEVMQALSDPALVQAVTSHDYQAVQNNPKIQELMSTPKMQALLQKIAAQQHTNSSSQ